MGVSGLWDVLALAGQSRSLANIAVSDGYEINTSRRRALRIGVDASIWFRHAKSSKEGENPELRMLFFRLKELAKLPVMVLFVFDGRMRPKVKRGSKMGKSGSHGLSLNFKKLIEAFGMEWREAHGEAEAELAYLNRTSVIDAIMTDDADAFVFGAKRIIRNVSVNLTGNKAHPALNMDGKTSKHHVMVFDAETIKKHPNIGLSRGGMVLFALLTGGDYDKGIDKFGKVVALALARCGFGDELLDAVERREERSLNVFFRGWRQRMDDELHTNSRGFLKQTKPGLFIPDDFPRLELLDNYACPVSSASMGIQGGGPMRDRNDINLKQISGLCEKFFEWGTRTTIIKRFRSLIWEACVIRILRRAALEQDQIQDGNGLLAGQRDGGVTCLVRPSYQEAIGTPHSLIKKYLDMNRLDHLAEAFANREPAQLQGGPEAQSFLLKITMTRQHVSTDKLLEYRVKVDPKAFVELANSGIKGTRNETEDNKTLSSDEEDEGEEPASGRKKGGSSKAPVDPLTPFLMWVPASMIWYVNPQLADEYEQEMEDKKQKKGRRSTKGSGSTRGKRKPVASDDESGLSADEGSTLTQPSPPKKRKNNTSARLVASSPVRGSSPTLVRLPQEEIVQHNASSMVKKSSTSRLRKLSRDGTLDESTIVARYPFPPPTSESVSMHGRKLTRTASSSFMSGTDDIAEDNDFPFLFKIRNPDDPELIEREDLKLSVMKQDSVWKRPSSSAFTETRGLLDESEAEFDLRDDARDKQHEHEFIMRAQSSANQTILSKREKSSVLPTSTTARRNTVSRLMNNHGGFAQHPVPPRFNSQKSDINMLLPSSSPPGQSSPFSQRSSSSTFPHDDNPFGGIPGPQNPPSSSSGPPSPFPSSSQPSKNDLAKYRAVFYE